MKKIFAALFSLAILTLATMVMVRFVNEMIDMKNGTGRYKESTWNAAEHYPFADGSENDTDAKKDMSVLDKLEYNIKTLEGKIETGVTVEGYYYQDLVLFSKYIDRFCGMNCTTSLSGGSNDLSDSNDIVLQLSDGYLSFVLDDFDISENVDSVVNFGRDVTSKGMNFLYLEVPYKMDTSDAAYEKYAPVYPDHFEEKTKEIRKALEDNSLCVVGLDDYFPELISDRKTLFFKTDHHWLPQTGLRACAALCDSLNSECSYNIDTSVFNLENYEITDGTKMLGSQGRKVTEVYTDIETLPVVTPLYDTDLTVFISGNDMMYNGSIQETLFDYSKLDAKNYYTSSAYTFYGYGDQPYIKVHNNLVNDGTHLLVIKKSFADCMIPYLAGVVEDMDVLDLRYFKGSLQTFIEKEKPDTVVVIYGTTSFEVNPETRPEFDFR